MPENTTIDSEYQVINRTDQPSMWDGFSQGPRPGKYAIFFDDFLSFKIDDWTSTEIGTNTVAVKDEVGGVASFVTGATDGDGFNLQLGATGDAATGESFLPAVGKAIYFEARVKCSEATQSEALIGLSITDTTAIDTTTGIYFRKDDGDTQIDCETKSTTASTETNVATFAASTWVKLGFKVTGTDKVDFYVDDVKKATLTTLIPTTEMRPTLVFKAGDANARTWDLDYIFVAQER